MIREARRHYPALQLNREGMQKPDNLQRDALSVRIVRGQGGGIGLLRQICGREGSQQMYKEPLSLLNICLRSL
jgi:hypothetical protein